MKLYRVYLLRNEAGKSYIGISEDVENRLEQHNAGVSKWTAKYKPWKVAWVSVELSLGDARKLENRMKRQKGGQGLLPLMEEFKAGS